MNTRKKIHQKSAAKASLLFSETSSPARPGYKPVADESSFAKLPFVYSPTHGFNNASNWHMPPTEDYAQACKIGGEYAAHFAQYLRTILICAVQIRWVSSPGILILKIHPARQVIG